MSKREKKKLEKNGSSHRGNLEAAPRTHFGEEILQCQEARDTWNYKAFLLTASVGGENETVIVIP